MSEPAAQREMPTGPSRPQALHENSPQPDPAPPANEGGSPPQDPKPAETRAPDTPSEDGKTEAPAKRKPVRRFMRRATRATLLLIVPVCILLAGAFWYMTSGRYVTTENAYVKSQIIAVSPSIDGRVVEVLVSDNERVQRGDTLFRLNARPHQIAVDQAEAKLAAARQEIDRRRAEFRQVQAEIDEAKERVAYFTGEFER